MVEWFENFWNSLHPALQALVGSMTAGIAVAVIVGMVKLIIGIIRKLANDASKAADNRLRIHFAEIKTEAISISDRLHGLTAYCGWLTASAEGVSYRDLYNRKSGVIPVPTKQFAAHLPEETSRLKEYRKHIEKHNKKRSSLDARIKQFFASERITLSPASAMTGYTCCVSDSIYAPLFAWWQDSRKPTGERRIDFTKVATRADGEPGNLYVDGWGAEAAAYAGTDQAKQTCITAIGKLANSKKCRKEAGRLADSSDNIIRAAKRLGAQLTEKTDNVEKYWPGTRSYKFTKNKEKCPKCQEIFH